MGKRGTEVARQAADLVLADDNLQTVVTAAEEGRRVYGNIRRFLLYGLSGGSAEIAVMLAGPALGLALPLLPAQILWVNLLTHGLPGVALGGEPADPGIMNRPGRQPRACSAPRCGSGSSGSASWSPRHLGHRPVGARHRATLAEHGLLGGQTK
jgi:magnesium-transporting ATPase (P-type)